MTIKPYIITLLTHSNSITVVRAYNPKYDSNDKYCLCGHSYYRHFDSYERVSRMSCKYCLCHKYVESAGIYTSEFIEKFDGLIGHRIKDQKYYRFMKDERPYGILNIIGSLYSRQIDISLKESGDELIMDASTLVLNHIKNTLKTEVTGKFRRHRIKKEEPIEEYDDIW